MNYMEKIGFEMVEKKRIYFLLSGPSASRKIVIMSHGFRGSSLGPARTFVDFARILNKHGFVVLRFDQPNCGNSQGDFLNASFGEWVDTTAHFAKKYLKQGFSVSLLGQSMGATASVIVAGKKEFREKLKCLLLWVPDPKSEFNKLSNKIYEEGGQLYRGKFFKEARNGNFYRSLKNYHGQIHLVYGQSDRYVGLNERKKVMAEVSKKGGDVMVLPGQDHSGWDYKRVQKVYACELAFLRKQFS